VLNNRSKFAIWKKPENVQGNGRKGFGFRAKPTLPPQEAGIAKERGNWE
jgi:hypothetical protein